MELCLRIFKWLPFYEQAKITKCAILFKRLQGIVPAYLKTLLKLSSETHSRETDMQILTLGRTSKLIPPPWYKGGVVGTPPLGFRSNKTNQMYFAFSR